MDQYGRSEPIGAALVTETENFAASRGENMPTFSTDSSLTVADSSMPSFSESALDITDSISLSDKLLSDVDTANTPSVELIGRCIGRLALVFPLNTPLSQTDPGAMAEVYANLLKGYSDEHVVNAFSNCAKRLNRIPYPADLIEAIAAIAKATGG